MDRALEWIAEKNGTVVATLDLDRLRVRCDNNHEWNAYIPNLALHHWCAECADGTECAVSADDTFGADADDAFGADDSLSAMLEFTRAAFEKASRRSDHMLDAKSD
jgi:hypothetical protein